MYGSEDDFMELLSPFSLTQVTTLAALAASSSVENDLGRGPLSSYSLCPTGLSQGHTANPSPLPCPHALETRPAFNTYKVSFPQSSGLPQALLTAPEGSGKSLWGL